MRQTTLFIIILALLLVLLLSGCKKEIDSGDSKDVSDTDAEDSTTDQVDDTDDQPSDDNADEEEDTTEESKDSSEDEDTDDSEGTTATLTKIDCTKKVAIGIVSSYFCKIQEDGSLEITLRNSGFVNITGVHIELMTKQKDILHSFDNLFDFQKGAENTFTVPAQDYSELNRIELSPVDGNSICQNRQLLVLPENSCD